MAAAYVLLLMPAMSCAAASQLAMGPCVVQAGAGTFSAASSGRHTIASNRTDFTNPTPTMMHDALKRREKMLHFAVKARGVLQHKEVTRAFPPI